MKSTFEQEGDVRGTDLLAGLVALWREAASGSLRFSRSGATAGFELARGELVASSSSDQRFETASILVRAGKLDAATLERLASPQGGDRALLALQAGVLTRREWRWGEKIRAVEILSDLLTWLDGEYWFFRTTEQGASETRLPIPRLILELFLRSRDRSLVLHYLGGMDVPIARAETFDEEFATFGLTADAESVVSLIDGKSSAAEIASQAPAEAFAVEKLLAAFVTLGLVHPEFGTRAPRSEPEEEEEAQGPDEPQPAVEAAAPDRTEPGQQEPVDLESGYPEADEEDEPEFRDGEMESEPAGAEMTDAALDGFDREPREERPLDTTTGIGSLERPRQGSGSPLLWTFGALAVLVAGMIWLRSRGPAAPEAAAAAIAKTASAAPEIVPTKSPATVAAATAPAAPTRTAVATPELRGEKPVRARSPLPAPAPLSSGSRQYWMDRAARDQKRFAGGKKPYAIQLELACEIGSLVDAFRHDRGSTMWVVPTSFQGKTCFRVLWGHYPTPEAGRRAMSGAPAFFSTPSNRPAVTAVR